MIALMLAAGYGTRMKSVNPSAPKSLLPLGGRVVIDYLTDQLLGINALERMILVTNDRFYDQFAAWARARGLDRLELLNDGTQSNEQRLGAIGDLNWAIEHAGIDDDLLVTGTDNIFRFEIGPLVRFFQEKQADVISLVHESDRALLSRTGVVEVDAEGRVVAFAEKPEQPASELTSPPLYILRRSTLSLVNEYLKTGGSSDAPGSLIAWLYKVRPVYGCVMGGKRQDIGCPETYRKAIRIFDPNHHHHP